MLRSINMLKKNYSGEAQWFLKNIQKIQDDFAQGLKSQVFILDKEGNLITEVSGSQKTCQIIQEIKEGKDQCLRFYQTALSLIKTEKEPCFIDCFAGFSSLWVPIKIKEEVVGAIAVCGGRYERQEGKEELTEKYSRITENLKIKNGKDFLGAALKEIIPVKEEEVKKRAERLSKLIGVLSEETALKEIFGIEE